MKQVLFVASTSYSGSTFLDMTLGNDAKGFSIGEVNALYQPTRPHHYHPVCGCYDDSCRLWDELQQNPVSELYTTLFQRYPEIEFIVDSSKDPLWIHQRILDLKRQGIAYKIVVIWKSPLEIAQSFDKRGGYHNWERSWVNYHRLLYTLQPDHWVTVSYQAYASHPESLENLCQRLEIPYFSGKERFWEKKHHLLFGNHSARKHLTSTHRDNQAQGALKDFQKILYKPVDDPELEQRVKAARQSNPLLDAIEQMLTDLAKTKSATDTTPPQGLRMSWWEITLRHLNFAAQRAKSFIQHRLQASSRRSSH